EELNALYTLHPALKSNDWLTEKFEQARQLSFPNFPPVGLYLALLSYPLTNEESEQLILRLRLPKSLAQTLRDTISIKPKLKSLANPELTPSSVYYLLQSHSQLAIITNSLACDSPVARQNLNLFLNRLRYVKPTLNGDNLVRMGIAPGPQIKEILNLLHEARLDGKATNKRGEEELVKGWLARNR
ncbi:unnamed protein product, partial [marine sediment metagenome]